MLGMLRPWNVYQGKLEAQNGAGMRIFTYAIGYSAGEVWKYEPFEAQMI